MITEELFVKIINCIRVQYLQDATNRKVVAEAFQIESVSEILMNNDRLYKSLIELLQVWFPVDENNHCEITHYCFFCNFGKPNSESEYFTPNQLYHKLCNKG